MSDRIRTLLLEANGTHWAAVCLDTFGQGLLTARRGTPRWIARSPRLRKLFGDRYADASYISDWRDAFFQEPRLAVETCNITNLLEFRNNRPKILDYDLVVVLHSAAGDRMSVLEHTAGWFQGRRGKLAMFIGNEYDLLDKKIAFAKKTGADYICTQLPLDTSRVLYADCGSPIVAMPHALNPRVYRVHEGVRRTIDVGFVGDLYERLIGDRERTDIVQFFDKHAAAYGLTSEIRTQRMPRDEWAAFLNTCHAVIGAESGTYYLQRNGEALRCAKMHLKRHPDATFDAVHRECFSHCEATLNGKAVSSRHFEPIGTKTCQVLIEGAYNDILKADTHFISVKRDLSNVGDAINRLKDPEYRRGITEAAYAHAMSAHTYDHRVRRLIDIVSVN
jgi:hypothetical protein